MKEKISQLAKEKFEYERPKLQFSEERLHITVEASGTSENTVRITNEMGRAMKGILYASDERITMEPNTFVGEEAEITVTYDATGESASDTAKIAEITAVSNFGVYKLFVDIKIEAASIESSSEKIQNLDQFTEVAKNDWDEALTIFKSSDFRRLLLTEPKDRQIYDGLVEASVPSQAMEQFLVATGQKKRVTLLLEEERKEYNDIQDEQSDFFTVKASEWGYVEATVTSETDAVTVGQEIITSEDIKEGSCKVPFTIAYGRLQGKKEKATITVTTVDQTLPFELSIAREDLQKQNITESPLFLRTKYEAKLVETYLEFRLDHLSKEKYEEEVKKTIQDLLTAYPSIAGSLWSAHLYLITGETEKLDRLMKQFEESEQELLVEALDYYLAYRYLEVLHSKDPEIMEETVDLFQSYLETEQKDWRLLWYLLYIDNSYKENQGKRVSAILSMLKNKVISPVLYYEAAFSYNKEPELLLELGREERLIMHWAIRNKFISKELASQFVAAASRVKKFDKLLLKDLMAVYEYRESTECLQVILRMLIIGQMTDNKYFPWYEMGVKKNVKITELYECYIYSMKEEEQMEIDPVVLQYFLYNNHLSEAKKAFLYAYIIKHKEENGPIYRMYLRQMESFSRKMALKGSLSTSLVVLYEEFITPEKIDEPLAKALPQILFRYEFLCKNKNIKYVAVRQPELKQESLIGVDDGKCFLNLATKEAMLFLVDTKKNRYLAPDSYQVKRLFYKEELADSCFVLNKENVPLLLEQKEKSRKQYELMNRLIASEDVNEEFKEEHYIPMLRYYSIHEEKEKVEEYLKRLNPLQIAEEDRKMVTNTLILYKEYDKAFKMVRLYGYDYVSVERLLELVQHLLSTHMVDQRTSVSNPIFLSMCEYLYRNGCKEHAILTYLADHYENTTEKMYQHEKALEKEGINTYLLQERLLGQMLFSEEGLMDSRPLFEAYYKTSDNKMLIRAYLNYMAYRYVRFDEPIEEGLCEMMKRESFYHESKVSMLALLKFYREKKELSEEEYKLIDYNLHKFIKAGIVLPFFMEYKDRIHLPDMMANRTYVEYKTDPDSKVKICYAINDRSSMCEAVMDNMFEGIFVKDFVLFYGETLNYYITEEIAGKERVTSTMTVTMSNKTEEKKNRFDGLNIMLEALGENDDEAVQELLLQYAIEDYITSSLFIPL